MKDQPLKKNESSAPRQVSEVLRHENWECGNRSPLSASARSNCSGRDRSRPEKALIGQRTPKKCRGSLSRALSHQSREKVKPQLLFHPFLRYKHPADSCSKIVS